MLSKAKLLADLLCAPAVCNALYWFTLTATRTLDIPGAGQACGDQHPSSQISVLACWIAEHPTETLNTHFDCCTLGLHVECCTLNVERTESSTVTPLLVPIHVGVCT